MFKLKFFFAGILSVSIIQFSFAQLTEQKKEYTRADTLRGSLRPERTCYDVTFYDLKVKLDTTHKTITGCNRIVFNVKENFWVMQFDLFDSMKIISVTSNGTELKYRRECNAVFVMMNEMKKAGSIGEVTVNYYGKPTIAKRAPWDGGFVWTADKNGKLWLGVACEGLGASCWWPCKDYLGDEPDSMRISCTVPDGLKCISNGAEESETENSDSTTTFNWFVHYPINTYNVTLNVGDYAHFSDTYEANDSDKLALDYYVLPYNLDKAKLQFTQVKPMLKCYEKYLGKYPFWNDGYALVETPYLGMEHQGAIAYGNKYLTGYAGHDYSGIGLDFDYIIIHETAHEWWGNSVSCSDLADMWIHESFATYTEAVYVECMYDKQKALDYINAKKKHIGNKGSIVGVYNVNEEGSGDMYSKGMLFLNTLRHVVNDDKMWWSLIKGLCDTTFKIKNTNYAEVVNYFNTKSGKNLSLLFEQYLKHAELPVLEYKLKKAKHGEFEITYRWNSSIKNFNMPFYVSTKEQKNIRLNGSSVFESAKIKMKKDTELKIDNELMYFESKRILR